MNKQETEAKALFEREFEKMLNQYKSAVDEKKRFSGLVKDFFNSPEDAKAVNLLLIAYDLGIVQDIQKTARINNTFAYRYVKQLMDDFGLSRVNADWIVSIWCVCYGAHILGKECEIKVQEQGSGPAIKEEASPSAGKKYGDLFVYKPSKQGNGLAITGFTGSMRQTVIFQSQHDNKNVIEIGDAVFAEEAIEEAIITEGIGYVGKNAFMGCKKLHQAVLPISIRELGDAAFQGCENLKSISLPELLERVGKDAFRGSGIRSIQIPKSIYWFGSGVFAECPELDNVVIPSSMDRITESMFEECTNLKKVTLHESLESIEDRAFFGCCNLDFIVIPDSVKSIGDNSFTGTNKRFIIQCSFGSYAEEYCRKNKIKYQLV